MKPTGLSRSRSVVVICVTAIVIGIPSAVVAGTRSAAASPTRPAPWGAPHPLSASQPHSAPLRWIGGSQDHITKKLTASLSPNWSGLIDTGAQFTGVSADWTVPAVQASTSTEYSSTWIGIDGSIGSSTLIQTGTDQDTSNGSTYYRAWYEVLPADPVEIVLGAVSPGDEMQASIGEDSPGAWTISIQDLTSAQGTSGVVSYNGLGASAEWIEEAPTNPSTKQYETLADFGTVQFTNLRFGFSGANTATNTYSEMVNSAGNVIAYPAPFDATNDSQQIMYGSPPNPPPPTTTTTTTAPPPTTTTTTTTAPPTTTTTVPPPVACTTAAEHPTNQPTAIAATTGPNGCPGYWIVNAGGSVFTFGNAPYLGGLNGGVASPVIDIIATPDSAGYWLVTANGTVRAFGDAGSFGDMSGHQLNGQIIAMATTPDGGGYWLVGSDGGIFSFGDAQFYGSTGAMTLNQPVVGIAATPDGAGYWLVAADGGIFSFGDAQFLGSMGATPLNRPVVGMTADPGGRGYRMVAADGGIFSFGAPFFGSLGANPPAAPIVNMAPSIDGNGYYMLGAGGGVYNFGDAPFLGAAS
jgi:hypothetical protein